MSRRRVLFLCLVAVVLLRPLIGYSHAPRQEAPAAATVPSRITFSETIAPIVYGNCVTCHRPGEAAPFSLITYDDVRKRGAMIARGTKTRFMPPWQATHGFGEFDGERRLTDDQIQSIATWVSAGMPQ